GRPGALGTLATFSFFPSKNLGCFGDGGAVTTDDAGLAERLRTLRFHGSVDKVTYQEIGYNSRLDDLQAAVLRVLLPHLDAWAAGRAAAGRHYEAAGLGELVTLPARVAGCEPAWHLYVVRRPGADRLAATLAEHGVGTKAYYRTPVHRQPAMAAFGDGVELPATEAVAADNLAIPMSAVLDPGQAGEVVAAVRAGLTADAA
ncbi:MAG: DegT/DnrJ/EryC1/StrS family aminotransferase, partial [Solirubrobacteraceae bacterium]